MLHLHNMTGDARLLVIEFHSQGNLDGASTFRYRLIPIVQ